MFLSSTALLKTFYHKPAFIVRKLMSSGRTGGVSGRGEGRGEIGGTGG